MIDKMMAHSNPLGLQPDLLQQHLNGELWKMGWGREGGRGHIWVVLKCSDILLLLPSCVHSCLPPPSHLMAIMAVNRLEQECTT